MKEELGILESKHPVLPLSILNYDIKTPKKNPIARACRSLVLYDKEIAARSFYRFFNWGESPEEEKVFNWSNFSAQTKEDGSLINLFFFEGEWHMTTKSTFGFGEISQCHYTWREYLLKSLNIDNFAELDKFLDRQCSYVCELTGPYNKVVRDYKTIASFFLAKFNGLEEVIEESVPSLFLKPQKYQFHSLEEIKEWILNNSTEDPTFEGIVVRDDSGIRFKIKSRTYYDLHQIRDNGGIFRDKNLLSHVIADNRSELVLYIPEVAEFYDSLKSRFDELFNEIVFYYDDLVGLDSQKEFALKALKTPMSSVYFQTRKLFGPNFTTYNLFEVYKSDKSLLEKLESKR